MPDALSAIKSAFMMEEDEVMFLYELGYFEGWEELEF